MFYYAGELKQTDKIELDINDSTWLYGATIFTTMRVYNFDLENPLTNWQQHLNRLKLSVNQLDWQPPNWQLIRTEIKDLLQYFPIIRITLFPDGKELIIGRKLPSNLSQKQEKGVKGLICLDRSLQRSLPQHKTGNYLTPWLGLQQAQKIGYQEAILTNADGDWLETSTGNLWGYSSQEKVWCTPDLSVGILSGIARNMIIENANFPVITNYWTPEFIANLEAIAYSNSVVEIVPFNTIKIGDTYLSYDAHHTAYSLLTNIFKPIDYD